jgi:hypothetical protein
MVKKQTNSDRESSSDHISDHIPNLAPEHRDGVEVGGGAEEGKIWGGDWS